jgi:hypothetical protein
MPPEPIQRLLHPTEDLIGVPEAVDRRELPLA